MLKRILLFFLFSTCALAEAPRIQILTVTSFFCQALALTSAGSCRPSIVVVIQDDRDPKERYMVGIRYKTKEGEETLEVRYPVPGNAIWFYLEDIKMLSATCASLKTNEVGLWFADKP